MSARQDKGSLAIGEKRDAIRMGLKKHRDRSGSSVRWFVIAGLAGGGIFSAYAVVLNLIRGGAIVETYDISIVTIVATYLAGGFLAGGIVGVLFPLTRWWFGAMLTGYIAALPMYALIGMADEPAARWSQELPPFLFFVAGPIGAVAGLILWYEIVKRGKTESR